MKALVLHSGGLDSTTALALAIHDHGAEHVLAVNVNYGQRHVRELRAARAICHYYGVDSEILNLSDLGLFLGAHSSQVGSLADVPIGHYAEDSMKLTIVPNRNMVMLACVGAMALSQGASEIWYGAHAGDHAIYPDCRPQFVDAMRTAFSLCDWKRLELVAPFLYKTKADIVTTGLEINVPFNLTRTCYNDGDLACGTCSTCIERLEAFSIAGYTDPIEYTDSESWRRIIDNWHRTHVQS